MSKGPITMPTPEGTAGGKLLRVAPGSRKSRTSTS